MTLRFGLSAIREDDCPEPDTFVLWVGPLAEGEATEITLDERGCIPPQTKIPRAGDVYGWSVCCTSQDRNVVVEQWVRITGNGPIDILQLPKLSQDELTAELRELRHAELERQRELDTPPPEPPRRTAAKVEGATFGFIPGAALAVGTCDAAPALLDENSFTPLMTDHDRFGVLDFHLPTKAVVAAATARVRVQGSAYLSVALYSEAGDRLVKAALRGDKDGPVSAVIEPPVELPAGNYRFAWAASPADPRMQFQCLKLERESVSMLNEGGGEIVVGVSCGRERMKLPKQLGEIELAGERFPMPPKVLFKA